MKSQDQGNFTRGSQVVAHKVRMFGQGTNNSLLSGLICAICWLLWRMYQKLHLATLYYFAIERYVQLKLFIGKYFYNVSEIGINFYHIDQKAFVFRGARDFVYKFWRVTPFGYEFAMFWKWVVNSAITELLLSFTAGLIAAIIFFVYKGGNILGASKIRGGELVESKLLARMIRRARAASKIVISGLPLIKNSETQHILLTGTTGSGKTNLLNELLPQIRDLKQRAIIFDLTGSFVNDYYNPDTDILLNPFAENTANWLPWNDCEQDFEFDALAGAFIDGEGFSDKFWEEAAQKVLSEALQKERESKSLNALLNIIAKVSLTEFCRHFEGTFASGLVSGEAEKGTASVRSTLLNKVERLKYLKEEGSFSIKEWVNRGNGWLFITALPNQRDTLRPLVSAWIDIAIKGVMDRSPQAKNENMWFILDELPALKKISSLKRGLAEGRKYGACFVAGIQNTFQIEEIYGAPGASALLDMFNTRFFFRVGDEKTAEYASRALGKKEISETREALSYGANSMRDGVNINTVERTVPLVMATEIQDLPARTCYVKLAENYPVTRLSMKLQKVSSLLLFFHGLLNRKTKKHEI